MAKIQDEKIKAQEWEVSQLQKRASSSSRTKMNEITEFIDNGDNPIIITNLDNGMARQGDKRFEINQDDMEQALGFSWE